MHWYVIGMLTTVIIVVSTYACWGLYELGRYIHLFILEINHFDSPVLDFIEKIKEKDWELPLLLFILSAIAPMVWPLTILAALSFIIMFVGRAIKRKTKRGSR